jgi:glycosyltransferase involved in cell wall biosynthesis
MKNHPLVSYIIPNFNQAKYLYEAVSSILLSYSGPKEIIVIDDCSTDPTTPRRLNELISKFPFIKLMHNERNKGLSRTRNAGLAACEGDYVQFLDADDLLFPHKIDFQIQHFWFGNNLDISITDYLLCDETLSEFTPLEPNIGKYNLSLDDFLFQWERGLTIPIHSALFKRSALSNVRFNETLSAKEDWLFWCTQLIHHKRIAYLNIFGAAYRQHEQAMTKKNVSEMSKMWLKSASLIAEQLEDKEAFLAAADDWYHTHYEYAIKEQENIEKKKHNEDHNPETKPLVLPTVKPHNTSNKKTFSVIIPIYNHFEYLNQCLQSVFDQTFEDYEIICVDDHSPDPRVQEALEQLRANTPNVKVIFNEANLGISASFNRAIEIAEGEFIAFLDCDDYLSKEALEQIDQKIIENPEVDYFFTDKIDVDESNRFIRRANYGGYPDIRPSGDIADDLLDGMVASHLKVIRKAAIVAAGKFNPELDGVQDYDLALRIAGKGKLQYVNKPLYYHRQHFTSVTSSDSIRQFRNQNIARRAACDQWYPKAGNPGELLTAYVPAITEGKNINLEELEAHKIRTFMPKNFTQSEVKDAVKQGYMCILDTRGETLGKWAYLLRDYNSYFDLIIIDDPQIAIFLIGYLWDYHIIKFIPKSQ